MIGNTLSHYKIIEKLGQGGMGEVYLAEDNRLDRKVALKILPQHLSERAELRERFEREARAVSSLNHPHICTLHDIGEQDGIHYLVMEHLEGETLSARLEKGALPLEQTLEYAIQIADALDKAHRQGVVHRDLKPGNIMLTKSGAKLLDFGLAKLQAAETPTNLSALPTEQANLTAEGTILGTLQYMAPEQLEGKEADNRTDIFAFGATVYEMATGKKAFEGKSQASLIAAIMEKNPPAMAELQPMTPSVLDWVVNRCLAKEPDERWQSATDLMAGLKRAAEVGTEEGPSHRVTIPSPWRSAIPWGLMVLIAGIAVLGLWSLWPEPLRLTRLNIEVDSTYSATGTSQMALSSDGRYLAYIGTQSGQSAIYHRSMDQTEATFIVGTEGATSVFFSPDNQWVGFFADGSLKKVSLAGGLPLTICETSPVRSASWAPNGNIVFATSGEGLYQVSAAGGTPKSLTILDREQGERNHRHPDVLPGGNGVLFTVGRGSQEEHYIAVLSYDTGVWKAILEHGTNPRYSPTGHLLFVLSETLMAAPFDPFSREMTGDPLPVLENIGDVPHYAFSDDGTLIYLPVPQFSSQLVWLDRQGKTQSETEVQGRLMGPRLSPDGSRLSLTVNDGTGNQIWIYEITRGIFTPITFENDNMWAIWTPDGGRLAFHTHRMSQDIFWKSADGIGEAELLRTAGYTNTPTSWSRDNVLMFDEGVPGRKDVWMLHLDEKKTEPFLSTEFDERHAVFSPDETWIAFTSNQTGQDEVYVKSYSGGAGMVQLSKDGGAEPVWASNGRELFYRNGNAIMVVSVETEPSLKPETPRLLFEHVFNRNSTGRSYDLSPDGQRFVIVKRMERPPEHFNVVQNWFEELKRLVPTN